MNQQNKHRRREALGIVAAVCAGGVLPVRWRKPLVDTVITPVHAQTSDNLDQPASLSGDGVDTPIEQPTNPPEGPDDDPVTTPPDTNPPDPDPPVSTAPGTLTGFVTARAQQGKDAWPIDAVDITLTSLDNGGVTNIVSGGGGLYSLDLSAGRYAMSATKNGYFNWSLYPDVITINPDGISTQNITLVSSS